MAIQCGRCHGAHDSVAAVRGCYEQHENKPELASEKQLRLAQQLHRERKRPEAMYLGWTDREVEEKINKFSKGEASGFISVMLQQDKRPDVRQTVVADTPPGIYWNPKTQQVFKVYMTRSLYKAMKTFLQAEDGTWSWVYLGRIDRHFDVDTMELMPIEEAKKFGQVNGYCIRCGALLTDEGSIAEGIGPICAEKGMFL